MTLQLAGRKLANLDGWFGKSDPFFLIHKGREDGSWLTVAKSEIIDNNLNPNWKPMKVSFALLCNGDFNRPLRIEARSPGAKASAPRGFVPSPASL